MRKVHIGNATLLLADAFVEMPKIGDVDVIITDPPYNPKTHTGRAQRSRLRLLKLTSTV
jgi:DNA modification methylase